jgi:hypothetical protein
MFLFCGARLTMIRSRGNGWILVACVSPRPSVFLSQTSAVREAFEMVVLEGFSTLALEDVVTLAVLVEFNTSEHMPNASLHVEALQNLSESPQ